MAKYIIEVEDEPFVRKSCMYGEDGCYRAVVGGKIVFLTKKQTKNLVPYSEEPAYKRGQSELWDAVKKVDRMTAGTFADCFGFESNFACLEQLTASEYIDKVLTYEESKKEDDIEIKVGDEVEKNNCTYVVLEVYVNNYNEKMLVLYNKTDHEIDYYHLDLYGVEQFKKNGKHHDCIADAFKQIQEES